MTRIKFLNREDIEDIHSKSLEVLEKTGVKILNKEAQQILIDAGCEIESDIAKIPSALVMQSLKTIIPSFNLFSRDGKESFTVGNYNVLYDPGSSASNIVDLSTQQIRKATARDLRNLVTLTEGLKHIQLQSTALTVSDVPPEIGDLYRLYIVLMHSKKPVVTGAFTKEGFHDMIRMLEVFSGGSDQLREKPRAIFDCCPISPLTWGDETCQNLIDCAKLGVPAQIVPAPLIGATSPITISGTVIQTIAEFLSGLVISQLIKPGTPIICGCAPGVLDQRYGTPRFSAMEAIMTACSISEMGKYFGVPTHAYLGVSDSKTLDAQVGFESGLGIVVGALSEVNIISGPGLLSFLDCHSLEKLVLDDEIAGAAHRISRNSDLLEDDSIVDVIHHVGPGGNYLADKHTAKLVRKELYMPTGLVDRLTMEAWKEGGEKRTKDRARETVSSILSKANPSLLLGKEREELQRVLFDVCKVGAWTYQTFQWSQNSLRQVITKTLAYFPRISN